MAWIKTIEPDQAAGELKTEYDKAVRRASKVFNILKVQSLNPAALRASMDLYLATMHGPSGLSRAEREMLATVVSWPTIASIESRRTERISVGNRKTLSWPNRVKRNMSSPNSRRTRRRFRNSPSL